MNRRSETPTASPAVAPSARGGESLAARPGWTELREAADELHAAELLTRDPLARPTTVVPHLRGFWRAIAAAGVAAGIGDQAGDRDPGVWLGGELPGLKPSERERLREHWRALADQRAPSKRELRAQVEAARALLALLEPEIGGQPLHRRKRRLLWTVVGLLVLFAPLALYVALDTELSGSGPWRAAYFADRKLEGDPILMREDSVEHDWSDRAPHEAIAPDKFSVRWDTCLRVPEDGPVVFQVNANDGARVLVDGETIIDAWERDPRTRRRGFGSAEHELRAGVHHLRVEYFESLGDASIKLSTSLEGEIPGPIPRDSLSYPGDELDEQDPCAAVR